MREEVEAHTYCAWGSGNYGTFVNGIPCYDYKDANETRNYEFRLFLTLDSIGRLEEQRREDLTVFATINISDYIEEETINWGEISGRDDVEKFSVIRYDRIAKEFAPDEWKYLSERLRRFAELKPREPVIYKGAYMGDNEFFEFTEDTASSWGGPFECEGMKGCVAIPRERESGIATMKPITIQQDWGYWQLPQSFRNERKDLTDSDIYHMCGEAKAELFATFPVEIQFAIGRKLLREWNSQNCIYLQEKLPFRIILSGNDDTSHTKYFATKEAMEEELNYLRAMQPLDIVRDVYKREYEFTN